MKTWTMRVASWVCFVIAGACFMYAWACKNEWKSYERGAWAIVMHHKAYGNYGSILYREKAFEWGDPQNKEDIEKIMK